MGGARAPLSSTQPADSKGRVIQGRPAFSPPSEPGTTTRRSLATPSGRRGFSSAVIQNRSRRRGHFHVCSEAAALFLPVVRLPSITALRGGVNGSAAPTSRELYRCSRCCLHGLRTSQNPPTYLPLSSLTSSGLANGGSAAPQRASAAVSRPGSISTSPTSCSRSRIFHVGLLCFPSPPAPIINLLPLWRNPTRPSSPLLLRRSEIRS